MTEQRGRSGLERATVVAAYVQIGLLVFTVVFNTALGGHFELGVYATQLGGLLITLGLVKPGGVSIAGIVRSALGGNGKAE